jgi:hypothetical protein
MNRKLHLVKIIVLAAMSLLAERSHALYSDILLDVSNTVATVYQGVTNGSISVSSSQRTRLRRAYRDLRQPSLSVERDYDIFVAAARHLGRSAFQEPFHEKGATAYTNFLIRAQYEILVVSNRVAALNQFVAVKGEARRAVRRAQDTYDGLVEGLQSGQITDEQVGILVLQRVYHRIRKAKHLAAIGERHPGWAPDNVEGKMLSYTNRSGANGSIHFDDASTATQVDTDGNPNTVSYTWTRTSLNRGRLVLTAPCDEGPNMRTTTVRIRFRAVMRGTFSARQVECDGSSGSSSGRFGIQ